jgi:uncharacterized membrane protein
MGARVASMALMLSALSTLACVSDAHAAMTAARARYEQCVAAASERECVAEKERMLAAERSYQESSERVWGCQPGGPECPPQR